MILKPLPASAAGHRDSLHCSPVPSYSLHPHTCLIKEPFSNNLSMTSRHFWWEALHICLFYSLCFRNHRHIPQMVMFQAGLFLWVLLASCNGDWHFPSCIIAAVSLQCFCTDRCQIWLSPCLSAAWRYDGEKEKKASWTRLEWKKISPVRHFLDSHSSDSELWGLMSLQKSLLWFYLWAFWSPVHLPSLFCFSLWHVLAPNSHVLLPGMQDSFSWCTIACELYSLDFLSWALSKACVVNSLKISSIFLLEISLGSA